MLGTVELDCFLKSYVDEMWKYLHKILHVTIIILHFITVIVIFVHIPLRAYIGMCDYECCTKVDAITASKVS